MTRNVSITELSHHAHDSDGWIALNGVVWDMSHFAATHPGGAEVIQSHLGKDGSELYNEIHSPGLVAAHLGANKRIGTLEGSEGVEPPTPKQNAIPKPDLSSIVSVAQFQDVAETVLSDRAWGYVFGATEDGHTNRENVDFFRRIMFRPRVLPGSSDPDTSTTLLGRKYALPFFSAPTSSVRVSHPDGEVAIAKASVAYGVPAIVPTMSSYAISEIVDAMPPQYPFLFQLYVNNDRAKTEQCLDEARRMGARAVLVTVDLPVLSKRQVSRPRRGGPSAPQDREESEQEDKPAPTGAGALAPPPTNMVMKEDLSWDDIKWIQKASQLPIFLKGIQTAQDAKRAYEIGCAGIVLSNHGGRAVDTAPPAILTLLEIHAVCPEILSQMEIILDGGIRRGSDILKAVCLGANAVCLGRPFLYALSYGEEGVHHAFNILTEELKIAMTLIGITSLDEAHPGLLNTGDIDHLIYTRDKYPLATANILRKKGHKL